jgi:hypothetical protein
MTQICDICNTNIPFGNPYIAVLYNIENYERDHLDQQDMVNVISSDQILTMCGKCGNKHNINVTAKALELMFKQKQPHLS